MHSAAVVIAGPTPTDSRSTIYLVAALAGCDHRVARRWYLGGRLPGGVIGERIEAAARQLGVVPMSDNVAKPREAA